MPSYDVIVIGGGHAGCEAAAAAASAGLSVLLLTPDLGRLADYWLLNHTGGEGRDLLLSELDARGGLSPRIADAAAIKIRRFSRQPNAPIHAQIDRELAAELMRRLLESLPSLTLASDQVLHLERHPAGGWRVVASRQEAVAPCVVLAVGTRLERIDRVIGESPTRQLCTLGRALRRIGLPLSRIATGTSAVVEAEGVLWDTEAVQHGNETPVAFSSSPPLLANTPWRHPSLPEPSPILWRRQLPSLRVATTPATRALAQRWLAQVDVQALPPGPGHCPSLDRRWLASNQEQRFWLQAESWRRPWLTVGGMETALPCEGQQALLTTIPSLAGARLVRPGTSFSYAVVGAALGDSSLMVPGHYGLFLAGQVLGTNGVAESAALGWLVGMNAARVAQHQAPLLLDPAVSIIGRLAAAIAKRPRLSPTRVDRRWLREPLAQPAVAAS